MKSLNFILAAAMTLCIYGCNTTTDDNKDGQEYTSNDDYSRNVSAYSGGYDNVDEENCEDDVEEEKYDEDYEAQKLARQGDRAYYEVMELLSTYEYRFEHASSKYALERELDDFADEFADFSNKYTEFTLTPSQDAEISSAFQEIGFLLGQRYIELGATKSDIEYIQRKYFQL
jgi:hypothetical protein